MEPTFSYPERPSRKIEVVKKDADGEDTTATKEIEEYEFKHLYDVFRKKWDKVEEDSHSGPITRLVFLPKLRCAVLTNFSRS